MSQAPSCRVAAPARRPLPCATRHAARLRLAVSRAYPAPSRTPRLSYHGPSGRVVGPVPHACWPCPGLAVLYCNTAQPFLLWPVTIQSVCIAIQVSSLALQPVAIQYTVLQHSSPAALPATPVMIQFHCIVRLLPSQPNCNTPSVLQYKILPSFPPIPQYTLLYCDTTSLYLVSPACNTNFAF